MRSFLLALLAALLLVGCSRPQSKPAPPLSDALIAQRLGMGVVRSIACSYDGHWMAVASDCGRGYVWDLQEHGFHAVLDASGQPASPLTAVGFTTTGTVVTASQDGDMRTWSVDGKTLSDLGRHGTALKCLAVAGDQAVAGTEDGHLLAWDMHSPRAHDIAAHSGAVNAVAAPLNGKAVYSAGQDGSVKSWTVPEMTAMKSVTSGKKAVLSLACSTDGARLYAGSEDGSVTAMDSGTLGVAKIYSELNGPVTAVAVFANFLGAGSSNEAVAWWDMQSGKVAVVPPPVSNQPSPNASPTLTLANHRGAIRAVAFTRDGQYLAAGGDERIVLLHEVSGPPNKDPLEVGHPLETFSVALSPDNRWIASGGSDSSVLLWDPSNFSLARILPGGKGNVESVAYSPQGLLATGSEDGVVRLYGKDGKMLTSAPMQGQINDVAFSSDGKMLSAASWDRTVELFSVGDSSLRALGTLNGHTNGVSEVALSDAGLAATSSWDQSVRVWDVAQRKMTRSYRGMLGPVFSVAFAPHKPMVTAGDWNGTVWMWDASTDSASPVKKEKSHTDVVFSLAFSPDGTQLASGSADRDIIFWDSATLSALHRIEGFRGGIRGLSWTSDAKHLAVGTIDGYVFFVPAEGNSAAPAMSPTGTASP